jgi:hypothetical protein
MKIDTLIKQLQNVQRDVGNVDVRYIDMRFGNAPTTWDYTARVWSAKSLQEDHDETCYIEIQSESDPKYGNLDVMGREVIHKSTE